MGRQRTDDSLRERDESYGGMGVGRYVVYDRYLIIAVTCCSQPSMWGLARELDDPACGRCSYPRDSLGGDQHNPFACLASRPHCRGRRLTRS